LKTVNKELCFLKIIKNRKQKVLIFKNGKQKFLFLEKEQKKEASIIMIEFLPATIIVTLIILQI